MRKIGPRWGWLAGAGVLLVAVIGLSAATRAAGAADKDTAWLGVFTQDLSSELREGIDYGRGQGVLVNRVVDGSPAEKAGIRKGDVLVRYNNRQIDDAGELVQLVRDSRSGQRVAILIYRDGANRTINVTLGDRPAGGETPGAQGWSWRSDDGPNASGDPRIHIERHHDGDDDEGSADNRRLVIRGHGNHDDEDGDDHDVFRFHKKGGKPRVFRFKGDGDDVELIVPELLERLKGLEGLEGLEGLKGLEGLEGLEDLEINLSGVLGRGRLGVQIEDDDEGARVEHVVEGSAADKSGIKVGDVITKFGGEDIEDAQDLMKAVRGADEGSVDVVLKRDGRTQTLRPSLEKKMRARAWTWRGDRTPGERHELREQLRDRDRLDRDRTDRDRERSQRLRSQQDVRDTEREVRREMQRLREEMRDLERRLERIKENEE